MLLSTVGFSIVHLILFGIVAYLLYRMLVLRFPIFAFSILTSFIGASVGSNFFYLLANVPNHLWGDACGALFANTTIYFNRRFRDLPFLSKIIAHIISLLMILLIWIFDFELRRHVVSPILNQTLVDDISVENCVKRKGKVSSELVQGFDYVVRAGCPRGKKSIGSISGMLCDCLCCIDN